MLPFCFTDTLAAQTSTALSRSGLQRTCPNNHELPAVAKAFPPCRGAWGLYERNHSQATEEFAGQVYHSTHCLLSPPFRYRDYLEGKKKAYVLVAGRHQYFPKRELDTIEYSIENTYQGLYQEL